MAFGDSQRKWESHCEVQRTGESNKNQRITCLLGRKKEKGSDALSWSTGKTMGNVASCWGEDDTENKFSKAEKGTIVFEV